jgi:hypothetical protein
LHCNVGAGSGGVGGADDGRRGGVRHVDDVEAGRAVRHIGVAARDRHVSGVPRGVDAPEDDGGGGTGHVDDPQARGPHGGVDEAALQGEGERRLGKRHASDDRQEVAVVAATGGQRAGTRGGREGEEHAVNRWCVPAL